jgi:RNA polymerase sigma-70 factor (ECF subfamily)
MNREEMKTLIDKARHGERDAFDELYRVYATHILYQVSLFLFNKEDIEDAAQEIVYQMYTSIYQLRSSYAFSVWLHRIIKSVCYSRNKKNIKESNVENVDDYKGELFETGEDVQPEAEVVTKDRNKLLREIIGELPQNQRIVITMFYFDEMSYKEIAAAMDVTVSTVSTNIVKAKMRIKEKFEKRYKGDMAKDTEFLAGVAIGPALASALAEDAAEAFPAAKVKAFCDVCDNGMSSMANINSAASSGAHAGVNVLKAIITSKVVTVVAVACVTVAAIAVPITINSAKSQDDIVQANEIASEVSEAAVPYLPVAEISLVSDSENEQFNPVQASLSVEDSESQIAGWSIVLAADEANALSSGEGSTITDALTGLAPGEYKILWIVENGKGASATVKRSFTVLAYPH